MLLRVAVAIMILTLAAGCGAPAASVSTPSANAPVPASLESHAIDELAKGCPNPSDAADCREEILGAVGAGQPAALCVGPQADRWNITTPAPGDGVGSPCGPDNGGTIRGIIVAP